MQVYIKENLCSIKKQIELSSAKYLQNTGKSPSVRLVAVTKTKSAEEILEAYTHGQIVFGENYVDELLGKASHKDLESCTSIEWHFIGHLQRNKVSKLLSVQNLTMIESVDSGKLATAIETSWAKLSKPNKLKVMVQLNTSGEDSKHGLTPYEAIKVINFIIASEYLEFVGLMTIGSFEQSISEDVNLDFNTLVEWRVLICKELNLCVDDVELSMGMSHDFEQAVRMGSTNVRVGSAIFGARK